MGTGVGMGIGMDSLPSFAVTWAAMTAAMMSPSTLPFVVSFARRSSRRPIGSVVLVTAYLAVWTGFGVAFYFVSNTISVPWPASTAAGLAYGLSCVACGAGVMVALVALGMTNLMWLSAAAAVVFLYKLAGRWPRRLEKALTVVMVLAGASLMVAA